jgi:hypothetical protein
MFQEGMTRGRTKSRGRVLKRHNLGSFGLLRFSEGRNLRFERGMVISESWCIATFQGEGARKEKKEKKTSSTSFVEDFFQSIAVFFFGSLSGHFRVFLWRFSSFSSSFFSGRFRVWVD